MPNVYRPTFEEGERPEGFRSRRARIGYELGTELIGCSLWELPAGEKGEALRFPLGEEGAHQSINRSEEPVTLLAVSSHGRPDVVVYPASDKIGVGERLPHGGDLRAFFKRGDGVGYFEGESLDEA